MKVAEPDPMVGTDLEVDVERVAHGGHCVARYEGRVVFVRHTLPSERVVVRLTEAGAGQRFWRGDAVEVVTPSPDRVASAWPAAGPGGVGGGELAHVALPAQRGWKASVVAEQLSRLARQECEVEVEAAPGDDARGGLAWRTRVSLVADASGHAGMHRHRSHDVLALDDMPLGTEHVAALGLFERRWPAGSRIEVAAPAGGDHTVLLVDGVPWRDGRPDTRRTARTSVRENVLAGDGFERRYRVAAAGFWQVHREAPALLLDAVAAALREDDLEGASVFDLYSGAGLFTPLLAGLVGPKGRVLAVEGDARAAADARRNAHDLPQVELAAGEVGHALETAPVDRAAAVVLDPPRVGAGAAVVGQVAALRPSVVVYVACDPAALARDVSTFASHGYRLDGLRAFDLFPMTHHVECVARLVPSKATTANAANTANTANTANAANTANTANTVHPSTPPGPVSVKIGRPVPTLSK